MTRRGLFAVRPGGVLAWAACLAGLMACQPALNWRAARVEGTQLTLLFPCKPDHTSRNIQLAAVELSMQLLSCSAQGSTYALTHATLAPGGNVDQALAHWRRATLAHVSATHIEELASTPLGALARSQKYSAMRATGTAPSGEKLQLEARWFAQGLQVFQAVVYTQGIAPEALAALREPFFEGLQLQ